MIRPVLLRSTLSFALLLALLLLLAALPMAMPKVEGHPRPPASPAQPVAKLFGGMRVTQELVALSDNIESVSLNLATYRRKRSGKLTLEVSKLVAGRWQTLGSQTIGREELLDNAYHEFQFSPMLRVARGERVAISLIVPGPQLSAIAWYATPTWSIADHRLLLDGQLQPGTAHFRVVYEPLRGHVAGQLFRRAWPRVTGFLSTGMTTLVLICGMLSLLIIIHLTLWSPVDDPRAPGDQGRT